MKLPDIRLVWQSPKLFANWGLFIKINNKRYKVF